MMIMMFQFNSFIELFDNSKQLITGKYWKGDGI